jgi:4-hydroxy-tetrahydrodipicolinate reductase
MNLAIIGYGKMGQLIEQLAPDCGFDVTLKLDIENNANYAGMTAENFEDIDVAIEFSVPDTAAENLVRLADLGVTAVVGTTGWLDQMDRVRAAVEKNGTGLVWAPNFSVGVNVFNRLAAEAAKLLAAQPEYGAWAWEIHHDAKVDAPSGTMLKLVDTMKRSGYNRPIDVASNRAGKVPGTHEIGFDSAADTITLKHQARSRVGFASGALTAARWVVGKQGVHEFSEVLFGE